MQLPPRQYFVTHGARILLYPLEHVNVRSLLLKESSILIVKTNLYEDLSPSYEEVSKYDVVAIFKLTSLSSQSAHTELVTQVR